MTPPPDGSDATSTRERITQDQIDSGELSLDDVIFKGRNLVIRNWKVADGFGNGIGRTAPNINRLPGPDSTSCMSCHGPAGEGDPRAQFPMLAGQHAVYTRTQLENYRLGTRSTDPQRMMRDIALKLTPDEMAAVASYISGLH